MPRNNDSYKYLTNGTNTWKLQWLPMACLSFQSKNNHKSNEIAKLLRLTSIQCERLDHCRHDCWYWRQSDYSSCSIRGNSSQAGERERVEPVGGSGWGISLPPAHRRLHPLYSLKSNGSGTETSYLDEGCQDCRVRVYTCTHLHIHDILILEVNWWQPHYCR